MAMDECVIIDGKKLASKIQTDLGRKIVTLKANYGVVPKLAVILVGKDLASEIYVSNKQKKATAVGIDCVDYRLSNDIAEEKLLDLIEHLNRDYRINGILVQFPLPGHIDQHKVINKIAPDKDVDGFGVINTGKLCTGQEAIIPCTPNGCLYMIKDVMGDDLSGKKAIVVGRSNIVGKPMAQLLLKEHCTVVIAHSKTRNLQVECKSADIIVSAVGRPSTITKSHIKYGAVVIDVGINRAVSKAGNKIIIGDVEFSEVKEIAGAVSPVPGGVGPMTVIFLLVNALCCALIQNKIDL